MENDYIVFHGNLAGLLEKMENGEIPIKFQASYAPTECTL
jgi:hypothetical protein